MAPRTRIPRNKLLKVAAEVTVVGRSVSVDLLIIQEGAAEPLDTLVAACCRANVVGVVHGVADSG